jgi:hypothetical protein
MQQPPFSFAQFVYPAAESHDPICPPQLAPSGQQPTVAPTFSGRDMQVSPVAQQLFGYPIDAQLLVPVGH